MAVDADTVREMARLARLSIPDDQLEDVAADMAAILEFMGAISKWDGVPAPAAPATRRRADQSHDSSGRALVEAAASVEAGEVLVPPIKGAS